jgi:hypothetical protein
MRDRGMGGAMVGQELLQEGAVIVAARQPSAAVCRLRALWQAKRSLRRLPRRDDFSVLELAPWLGRLNLISVHPEGSRFDIFGTDNSEALGIEPTGLRFAELPNSIRVFAETTVERAVRERTERFETVRVVFRGRRRIYDRLVLPLGNDGETVDRVLTLIDSAEDEIVVAARRFSVVWERRAV